MNRSRMWTAGTAVAVAAILALGWFVLISPKKSEAKELEATAASTIDQNHNTEQQIKQLKLQQQQVPAQQAKIAAIQQQMPKQPLQPALIRQLTDIADDADVNLVSLTPTALAPLAGDAGVSYMGLSIVVTGDFPHLKQYLFGLEENKRALLVTGFNIAPSQEDPSVLSMTTNGRAFVAVDAPATGTSANASGTSTGSSGTAANSSANAN